MCTRICSRRLKKIKMKTSKRRTRVKRACLNCKKSKTCCSNFRPCSRCDRLGYECVDMIQNKRVTYEKNEGSKKDITPKISGEGGKQIIQSKESRLTISILINQLNNLQSENDTLKKKLASAYKILGTSELDELLNITANGDVVVSNSALRTVNKERLVAQNLSPSNLNISFYKNLEVDDVINSMGIRGNATWSLPNLTLSDYDEQFFNNIIVRTSDYINQSNNLNCASITPQQYLDNCKKIVSAIMTISSQTTQNKFKIYQQFNLIDTTLKITSVLQPIFSNNGNQQQLVAIKMEISEIPYYKQMSGDLEYFVLPEDNPVASCSNINLGINNQVPPSNQNNISDSSSDFTENDDLNNDFSFQNEDNSFNNLFDDGLTNSLFNNNNSDLLFTAPDEFDLSSILNS
eukprot:TRINITY_DN4951_c0_g2_i1.p1 TRINITY_DN4951_c0_g2~~TRINITY_DN4951_c0_g2_i1.p1  ORF type:complete len:405 (-),score=74.95 TRINITY_DN4951_c0_g2_i1:218-1432(-)